MNKADLVDSISHDAGISRADAGRALDAALKNIERALKRGEKVTLVNFGTFSVSRRKGRTGRNPQTGKPIKIPARKVAKFVPGRQLKAAIN